MKICSGGDKMRNASGHQYKVKMSGSEKKKGTRTRYEISLKKKRVTKKFLEVSHCSHAKQRQQNVPKRLLHVQNAKQKLHRPIKRELSFQEIDMRGVNFHT